MRAYVLIDQSAFLNNIKFIKQLVGVDVQIMAMLKGNCYGHGVNLLENLDKTSLSSINYFGVALLEEGVELKLKYKFPQKIVVMSGFYDSIEFEQCYLNNLSFVLHNWEQINYLESVLLDFNNQKVIKNNIKKSMDIWFKIDTGMHRLGFDLMDAYPAFCKIKEIIDKINQKIKIFSDIKLMTHFACADEENSSHVHSQINSFDEFCKNIYQKSGLRLLTSAFNTKALLNYAFKSTYNIVRPGLMLYGVEPNNNNNFKNLSPVMELRAKIISIKNIKKGDGVGYGQRWVASENTKLAVISIGYADGYFAGARDGTPVLIKGFKVPLVGKVSMDSIVVNINKLIKNKINLNIGDEAILWGKDLPVSEVAQKMGCSVYSLLTGVNYLRVSSFILKKQNNFNTNKILDKVCL